MDLLLDNLFQERSQLRESCVGHVIKPTLNEYAIVWLELEVLSNVIHDNCAREVTADAA